ncbi:dihydrofolate reductase [Prolixibacteraceae bacterium JC049]|nr:dihydrofolate reductase [Prolixibacteraceae bacterium JC049]
MNNTEFKYQLEQFADIKILRYRVPHFEELPLQQKKLLYFLGEAALCGRDIIWDQNYKHNLKIRQLFEHILINYTGDKNNKPYSALAVFLKRIWLSNGIHHHYSMDKLTPEFTESNLLALMKQCQSEAPISETELKEIMPVIFNPGIDNKRVSLDTSSDLIKSSANNYYQNISQKEVEEFYNSKEQKNPSTPISWGANSTLIKEGETITEQIWHSNGKYGAAIKQIVFWLKKALDVAENTKQEDLLKLLIQFYETGDLQLFDQFNILWVSELDADIDFINGFIEVYGDAMGIKASWEAVVQLKDEEATKRTETISKNAQWFEDHSPVDKRFKKSEVKGVSARVINATILGGDCHPATPIGINLPNAEWIREQYGSKSVTIENITHAYHMASLKGGMLDEFAYSEEEKERAKQYGYDSGNLHTDLHECLGHGSGKLLPDVSTEALKNYGSTIEEARADLFALYYMIDPKIVELGLLPNEDAAKSEYDNYIRNGLMTQLVRIEPEKNLEESHMRNRQLIAKWAYENGKTENIIERVSENNKTYFVIRDYHKLRNLFGQLLAEVQRIKSEGDFNAAQELVETYGVKIEPALHSEVLERYKKLNLAPYAGFVNPQYTPVFDKDNNITDIKIEYVDSFASQMLHYSSNYSFL